MNHEREFIQALCDELEARSKQCHDAGSHQAGNALIAVAIAVKTARLHVLDLQHAELAEQEAAL